MILKNRSINLLLLAIPDLLLILASLYIALYIRFGQGPQYSYELLNYKIFVFLFLVWILVMFIHNLFDLRSLRTYGSLFFSLVSAFFFNLLLSVVYFYFQPNLFLTPRRTLLLTTGISFVLILLWHLAVKLVLQNKISEDYFLYSEDDDLAELANIINSHGYLGFRLKDQLRSLDQLESMPQAKVIISDKTLTKNEILKKIYQLRMQGTQFYSHVDFYENLVQKIPLQYLDERWFLDNVSFRENYIQNFIRRSIDILIGIFLGLLFIATFPFIYLAIKLNTSGPVFFRQHRVGIFGKDFVVYKYRTMTSASTGKGWTAPNDTRITAAGKVLRRLHLDELPQFINLLKGNMSVVGPRPEQLEIVQEMRAVIPFYDERHLVKPGITGWAQLLVYAGSVEETRLKLEYDLYYLKRRSILFDLEIMLKTLYAIVRGKRK
jgi:exopolysaccharide biosynthesis polyprenyl glycosylphosphotransferase